MRLTVMTYNVGNGLARPDRLAALMRETTADIVGLQELAADQAEVLATTVKRVFPYQVLVPTGFSGKGLLSRLPLLYQEQLYLYPDRPDLRVVIDVAGTSLNVLVVHPPPPRLSRSQLAFDAATQAQFAILERLAVEHAPGVLLGDFNMTTRNPRYASLTDAGLSDAFAVAGVGRGLTLPVRLGFTASFNHRLQGLPLRPVARVDYIWYTPPLTAEAAWVGPDAGSDHLPVLARLAFGQALAETESWCS